MRTSRVMELAWAAGLALGIATGMLPTLPARAQAPTHTNPGDADKTAPSKETAEAAESRPARGSESATAPLSAPTTPGTQGAPFGRRLELVDYVATAASMGLYYAIELGFDGPTQADWTEPIPFMDRPLRAAFRSQSHSGRDRADRLSDRFWALSTVYPVALSLIAPIARGWSFEDIWQLQVMNTQAYMLASILTRIPHKFVGRLRPNSIGCLEDLDYSRHCRTDAAYVSFFGGHTGISMTGAGLACAHHMEGKVLGVPLADALGCMSVVGAAGVVFVTRLQADKHWFSDQLVATLVGLGVGYGLPTLLYYHPMFGGNQAPSQPKRASAILPWATTEQVGATWAGYF